jgi:hypothetical protein
MKVINNAVAWGISVLKEAHEPRFCLWGGPTVVGVKEKIRLGGVWHEEYPCSKRISTGYILWCRQNLQRRQNSVAVIIPQWTVGTNDHLSVFILHTKFSCEKVICSRFVQLYVQGAGNTLQSRGSDYWTGNNYIEQWHCINFYLL